MTKNLIIAKAYRFGNFVAQITHALHIALFYNYNLILPKHMFFNSTYIVINESVTLENEKIYDKDGNNFFNAHKIQNIDSALFNLNGDRVLSILKGIFNINKESALGIDDLVIHIRSGDLFCEGWVHPNYVTPPLSYYKNIINANKYDNIYLIAEDRLNPCINKLLELYPKIKFKIQSLKDDITLILRATNIVTSYGTFIPGILRFSDNIKNIYSPDYREIRVPGCITHITQLSEYRTLMGPWKNTPEQIKIMMTYGIGPEFNTIPRKHLQILNKRLNLHLLRQKRI